MRCALSKMSPSAPKLAHVHFIASGVEHQVPECSNLDRSNLKAWDLTY